MPAAAADVPVAEPVAELVAVAGRFAGNSGADAVELQLAAAHGLGLGLELVCEPVAVRVLPVVHFVAAGLVADGELN